MITINVRIAEHRVEFTTESEWVEAFIRNRFYVEDPESFSRKPDLNVHVEDGYGSEFTSFDVQTVKNGEELVFSRTDYRIRLDLQYGLANVYVFDDFALKHAMLNLYSTYIVHHNWGLLIHSSCILEGGKAYMFAGQSGAGKSTVAQLSRPRPILSDEATILKIGHGEVTVFDSPFRSDTSPLFIRESRPLGAIQLLRQSMSIKRTAMGKIDGMLELLGKVFYWPYETGETAKVFEMCKKLAHHIPIYELFFQKNDLFWKEIS